MKKSLTSGLGRTYMQAAMETQTVKTNVWTQKGKKKVDHVINVTYNLTE